MELRGTDSACTMLLARTSCGVIRVSQSGRRICDVSYTGMPDLDVSGKLSSAQCRFVPGSL